MPLAEAAERIGVSTRTVERMMDRGQLRFRRTPGGTRRLYRTSVEAYLATNLDTDDSER
jgi:excisionase family DNA binding protein